jgi:transposase
MHARGKHFTPAQKADIVRRHLIGKEPVSDLADRFGAQPSQVHNWVRQVLEQAEKAFQVGPGRPIKPDKTKDHRIKQLEAKLIHKNEVIAELMEEHVKLKKANGEP